MKCGNCGAELPNGSRFCTSCGAPAEQPDAFVRKTEPSAAAFASVGRTVNSGGFADVLRKNLLVLLCAIALIALLLPMYSVTASVDSAFFSGSESQNVSGFQAIEGSFFAVLLVVGPLLLIAMNFIKKLERHQGLLAIVIPLICIVSLIIVLIAAGSADNSGGNEYFSASTSVGIGFGAILDFLAYAGMIVVGAVKYHNFTFDKAGVERMKAEGAEILSGAKDRVSAAAQTVSAAAAQSAKQNVNVNGTEDILGLIRKLSEMKDNGILTEEEFAEKKAQLLSEI